jgi:hypothetical protein
MYTLAPREDLGLNIRNITAEAKKRYNIRKKRKK